LGIGLFLGAARTCILGSALNFIQISWFTCVFGNVRRVPRWV